MSPGPQLLGLSLLLSCLALHTAAIRCYTNLEEVGTIYTNLQIIPV